MTPKQLFLDGVEHTPLDLETQTAIARLVLDSTFDVEHTTHHCTGCNKVTQHSSNIFNGARGWWLCLFCGQLAAELK